MRLGGPTPSTSTLGASARSPLTSSIRGSTLGGRRAASGREHLFDDALGLGEDGVDDLLAGRHVVDELLRLARPPDATLHVPGAEDVGPPSGTGRQGLWNLFLPAESGISQLDYAGLAEVTGWSLHLAPEATNGQAPDTGNMELLHMFGTEEQKKRWLEPLLDGEIRSAFSMTEKDVASSDATNIQTSDRPGRRRLRDQRPQVVDQRRGRPAVQGAHRHGQDGPRRRAAPPAVDGPGAGGHPGRDHRARRAGVRPPRPARSLRGRLRRRARAGRQHPRRGGRRVRAGPGPPGPGTDPPLHARPGRRRASTGPDDQAGAQRVAFGKPLADQGVVQSYIAESRIGIDQARLLCQLASKTIDVHGNKAAAAYVSAAKVAVPRVALEVIDRAIQVHGGAGVSDDVPLARHVRLAPRHADLRRSGRGAPAHHRQERAAQDAGLSRRPADVGVARHSALPLRLICSPARMAVSTSAGLPLGAPPAEERSLNLR